jgi:phytoene dehydrogenase-like protein
MLIFSTMARVLAGDASPDQPTQTPPTIHRDVVIIGGGQAGADAAVRLKDQGLSVAVLQDKSQIGGHVEIFVGPDTGIRSTLGVAIFHDTPAARKYFASVGVGLARSDPGDGGVRHPDFSTGGSVPDFEHVGGQALGAELQAYAAALQAYAAVLAKYP